MGAIVTNENVAHVRYLGGTVTNGNLAQAKYLGAPVTNENGTQINVKNWECLLTLRSGFLLPVFYEYIELQRLNVQKL